MLWGQNNTQNSLYEQLNKEYCSVKENSVGYVHAIYDVDEVGISDTLKFCKEKRPVTNNAPI